MCRLFTVTIYRLFTVISESIVCKSLLLSYHDERLIGSPSFRSKVLDALLASGHSWAPLLTYKEGIRNRKDNLSIVNVHF